MSTQRISAEDAAVSIWAAIEHAGPDGLTKDGLLKATGLTAGQFANGLAFLKDFLRSEKEQPIAITPDYRYVLPQHVVESQDYLVSTMRGLYKRLQRADTGVVVHVGKFAPVDGRLLEKSVARLVEDLGDVLSLMDSAA